MVILNQPFPISKDLGKNHPLEPANHKEPGSFPLKITSFLWAKKIDRLPFRPMDSPILRFQGAVECCPSTPPEQGGAVLADRL